MPGVYSKRNRVINAIQGMIAEKMIGIPTDKFFRNLRFKVTMNIKKPDLQLLLGSRGIAKIGDFPRTFTGIWKIRFFQEFKGRCYGTADLSYTSEAAMCCWQ